MKTKESNPLLDIMKHFLFILQVAFIVFFVVSLTRENITKAEIRLLFDHPPDVMAPVYLSNKSLFGFVNIYGNMIIEADVDMLKQFSEGLAPFEDDDKWGYMDRHARIVIKPEYSNVGPFMSGIALVDSGEMGKKLIDKTGKVIRSFPPHAKVKRFRNGFIKVKDRDDLPCLLFDAEFNEIEVIDADKILSYSDGIFIVKSKEGNFSYMNEKGAILLTVPSTWNLKRFVKGYGCVSDADGYEYLVDNTGATVFDGKAHDLKGFRFGTISEGMIDFCILDGNYFRSGYMNLNGEIVIMPFFSHALPFRGGVAWVRPYVAGKPVSPGDKPSGFEIINDRGEILNPENFDEPSEVYDCTDYMLVYYRDDNKTMRVGAMDFYGNVLIPAIFSEPFGFSHNRAFVRYRSESDSIIDKTGRFVATNVGAGLSGFANINDTCWYFDSGEYQED